MNISVENISLEEKVAQLFLLGYEGDKPSPILQKFLGAGLGGIIFFRDNFQQMKSSLEVQQTLQAFQDNHKQNTPELFLSLDQEGGQVERLPHILFPSLITPLAIGLASNSHKLAKETYSLMASHLAALGFNFNYAPTLDVNLEPKNPIIGVRAFGDNFKTVWELAKIAKDCFWQAGIVPVGKHFPGHGNGTVDSHLKLPHLNFTEEELFPFQQAILDNIPVMLVSHGFYPALQKSAEEFEKPASASKSIIQDLLVNKLGFTGLIISDDMCMGAITQGKDPVDAAIQSIQAGIDMLVYKQSTESEWQVYQGIIAAVQSGKLAKKRIDEAYQKIIALKENRPTVKPHLRPVSEWSREALAEKSSAIAKQAITILKKSEQFDALLNNNKTWLLVHPKRGSILNYRYDQPTSKELPELLRAQGFEQVIDIAYNVEIPGHHDKNAALPKLPDIKIDGILFVSFNPQIQPIQQVLYKLLKTQYSDLPLILISAGTPYEATIWSDITDHIVLCSYRPPTMLALAELLSQRCGVMC